MAFQPGDRVEVCSKEDGFQGSYYAATVLSQNKIDGSYVVKYDSLVEEEDANTRLKEVVSADEIRPMPPKAPSVTAYWGLTKVDAYDNDGWWVGRITRRKGSKFRVYFDFFRQEISYPVSHLRPHHDWVNGKWIVSKQSVH